jgi:acyl-CoA thioester hydrolase
MLAVVPEPSLTPFVHVERVRFGDLDAMRHLNNVVFLRYFETARIAYLRRLVPEHDPARAGEPGTGDTGLIFAECHIAYRSPVVFDEEVGIELRIGEVRRSAFRVDFAMRAGDDRRLAAEGHGWLVGFDYAGQRAQPLGESLRARLEAAAAGTDASA